MVAWSVCQGGLAFAMLALVRRAQARLELAAPPAAGDEIKMKTALVPTIEPAAESAAEKNAAADSSDEQYPAFTTDNLSQENVGPSDAGVSVALKARVEPASVTTPADEERDFPL